MKKYVLRSCLAVVVVAVSVLVSGCTGINMPVTGTMPGVIFTNTAAGVFVNVPVRPLVEKYKVIEQNAIGEAASTSYTELVAVGDSTFSAAFHDIIKKYPEADDVIDIKVDVRKIGVLMLFTRTILTVRGTAIKYLTPNYKKHENCNDQNNVTIRKKLYKPNKQVFVPYSSMNINTK